MPVSFPSALQTGIGNSFFHIIVFSFVLVVFSHYGSTNVGIATPEKTSQPIAAMIKPIPKTSLIFIFWYPLWYIVY